MLKCHIVCNYGYKLICFEERHNKPHKTYFGEDTIDKCFNDMIKESEYCYKVIETEFNKPLVMAKKDHKNFNNFTKCWIFKKAYEKGEMEVKNHDHFTEKY